MINGQLRTSDVNEFEIFSAFAAVSRARNSSRPARKRWPTPTAKSPRPGRRAESCLSPRTLGLLLKCAAPVAGERALVVGGGSGYCAALLAALGLDVVALETDATAARAATAGNARIEHVGGRADRAAGGQGTLRRHRLERRVRDHARARWSALCPKAAGSSVSTLARERRKSSFSNAVGGGVSERAFYDAAADVLPGFFRSPEFAF